MFAAVSAHSLVPGNGTQTDLDQMAVRVVRCLLMSNIATSVADETTTRRKSNSQKGKIMGTMVAVIAALIALAVSRGPAPNSGDGIPDGSGMSTQPCPQSDSGSSRGPAPNSGDGVPDGSGF